MISPSLPDKFSFEGQVWFKSFNMEGKVDKSPSWPFMLKGMAIVPFTV